MISIVLVTCLQNCTHKLGNYKCYAIVWKQVLLSFFITIVFSYVWLVSCFVI